MSNIVCHKGNPVVMHDARPLVLLGHDFVCGGVEVVRVGGGEQCDVGLKLPTAGPLEGRAERKLQVSQPE